MKNIVSVKMSSNLSPLPIATVAGSRNPRKRKYKPRASLACDTCRVLKSKCDQGFPCQICKDREIPCVYGEKRTKPVQKNSQIVDKLSVLSNAASTRAHQTGSSPVPQQQHENFGLHLAPETQVSSTNVQVLHEDALRNDNDGLSTGSGNDAVAAINHQTSGTEFYGQSSNVVLVKQLLQQARNKQSMRVATSTTHLPDTKSPATTTSLDGYSIGGPGGRMHATSPSEDPKDGDTSQTPLSVVELFCDESSELPDPRPGSPVTVAGRAQKSRPKDPTSPLRNSVPASSSNSIRPRKFYHAELPNSSDARTLPMANIIRARPAQVTDIHSSECFFRNPMNLEKEYVNLYFQNLYLIYPFLSADTFRSRCETEIWASASLKRLSRSQMHFLALYNAVLALGALTASVDALQAQRAELEIRTEEDRRKGPKYVPSSIRLSRLYIQRARRLLGDIFEVCSLEGAQTLLLLSVYCQHALKLHASYMYSGMAVRTAIAIGLQTMANTNAHIVAKNTWSCIYIQEIKVSCSSGRSITLTTPVEPDYGQSQPKTQLWNSSLNDLQTSIISAQLGICDILRAASMDLYHSQRHLTLREKSDIALNLDQKLGQWKANLPNQLNPDTISFKESEFASRQKLSLQMRFYHTKMFIHRPFLAISKNTAPSVQHISICLATAHSSIDLTYSAFTHRIYFRTWWYNATHTFYASIIILYVLLLLDRQEILSAASLHMEELSSDIQKSLQVLRAMDAMPVSIRYAELVEEIFETSKSHAENPKESDSGPKNNQISGPAAEMLQNGTTRWSDNLGNMNSEVTSNQPVEQAPCQNIAYLSYDHNRGLERDDLLLSLMDPNMFDDFTMGNNGDMSFNLDSGNFGDDFYLNLNFASGQSNDLGS